MFKQRKMHHQTRIPVDSVAVESGVDSFQSPVPVASPVVVPVVEQVPAPAVESPRTVVPPSVERGVLMARESWLLLW
jgi:hypothetical protein